MIFVSSKDTEDPFLNLNQIGYANSRFPMIMGEVDLEVFSSPQVNATRNTTTQIEAQYINYGDVPAGNVTLKATLANGVTFVSANPAPSVSNPAMREYTWTLQPNPMVYPNSGSVKLFVKSLTVGNYPITWQISYAGSESDMHNNMEVVTLSIIDRKVYLPTIRR
jgi:hypothetical protein